MTYANFVLLVIALAVFLVAVNWVLTHLAVIVAVLLLVGVVTGVLAIAAKALRIW